MLQSLRSLWSKARDSLGTYYNAPTNFVRDFRYEIVLFALSGLVFLAVVVIAPDHTWYLKAIIRMVHGEMVPPVNFLYYLTVWAFAFFSTISLLLVASQVVVLSLAVALKLIVTKRIMYEYARMCGKRIGRRDRIPLAGFLLAFAFSLPSTNIARGYYYLGSAPPNQWINTTTIFLMPVALLLFWTSYKQLLEPSRRRIWLILLLAVTSILIKNNFFLVFAVVWPLFLARRTGLGRTFWENVLPIWVAGVLLLSLQGVLMLLYPDPEGAADWGLKIDFFAVWSHWQPNIPLGILVSCLFPLVYLLLHFRESMQNLLQRYALALMIAAFAVYAVFAETGELWYAGNFAWQQIVCNYILFMVALMLLINTGLPSFRLRKLARKDKVILAVFTLHVVSGVVYLVRMFLTSQCV